jgi:hypothetical protein
MALSQEQRVEMYAEKRSLHSCGDASGAAAIKLALDEDRYFMGLSVVPEPEVKVPSKAAKKQAWIDFALAVSDISPEVIEGATRKDIIKMLEVNKLIDRDDK